MSPDVSPAPRPSYAGPPPEEGRKWSFAAKFALWLVFMAVVTLLLAQIFTGCLIPLPNELADSPAIGYVEPPRVLNPDGAVAFGGPPLLQVDGVPLNTVSYSVESIEAGDEAYGIYCRPCHGTVDGTGPGPVGGLFEPPPPQLAERSAQLSDGQIFLAITQGFGRMPRLVWNLPEDQRWDVVNYIRSVTTGAPPVEGGSQARSALLFQLECATCHGPTAEGALGPALYPSAFLAEARPETIANIIIAGRSSQGMPSFSGYLSEEEAGNLAELLKVLQAEGPSVLQGPLERLREQATTTTVAGGTTTTTQPPPAATTTTTEPGATTTTTGGGADLAAAEETFANNCAACHGEEGRGGGIGPNLHDNAFISGNPDDAVRSVIVQGRSGTPMPAFGGQLSDAEIDALVALLNSWQGGADGASVRPAEPVQPAEYARPVHPEAVPVANRILVAQAESGADLAAAEETFANNCAACHGEEGRGGGIGPNLHDNAFISGNPDDAVRSVIVQGRSGTPMPAFGGQLSDAEIDALVALLNSWQGAATEGTETTESGGPAGTEPGGAMTTAPGAGVTVPAEQAGPEGGIRTEGEELPFSHRAHVARGMDCTFCHASARLGPAADVAPLELCAGCHRYLTTQTEQTQQVVAAYDEGRPVSWRRIYKQPDYVVFNHQSHVIVAEIPCSTCHGDVATTTIVRTAEVDQNMGFCLSCHEDSVYSLYEDEPVPGIRGSLLGRDLPIGPFLTGCGVCHG